MAPRALNRLVSKCGLKFKTYIFIFDCYKASYSRTKDLNHPQH